MNAENTLIKRCATCHKEKPLSGFFIAPAEGPAGWHGSSTHCIECHDAGLIPYGYGWPGMPKRPNWY